MTLVSVTQVNPNDLIAATSANLPHNQLAAVINGDLDDDNIDHLSGTKISAGTTPASAMNTASNPVTRYTDSFFSHVASGCVWSGDSYGSTLAASMTAGVAYIGGIRTVIAAVTARAFTASKDTYIDLDASGTPVYTEVANNAASPALTAGYLRIGIIVTGAGSIAAVASINQGQEDKVLPIASSTPYSVSDSLGNLICPRDPASKLLGIRRRTGDFTPGTSAETLITGLNCSVIVPTGRKVKVTYYAGNVTATTTPVSRIYEGIFGSGGTLKQQNNGSSAGAHSFDVVYTPASTSVTYTATIASVSGNTTTASSSGQPNTLRVELV
ncbi:hypothetical protein ACFU44_13735 [Nocardia rhizosphaerihabitans]|uniref:hypothetical protein n=1 Tax=Nocardia rhizosphaerihabitans TaxID=1691570 RepID=UPI00366F6239